MARGAPRCQKNKEFHFKRVNFNEEDDDDEDLAREGGRAQMLSFDHLSVVFDSATGLAGSTTKHLVLSHSRQSFTKPAKPAKPARVFCCSLTFQKLKMTMHIFPNKISF
jgi:hypothetical protein